MSFVLRVEDANSYQMLLYLLAIPEQLSLDTIAVSIKSALFSLLVDTSW